MYNVVESGTGRGCCAVQTCFYICPDLISSMFSKLDQCSRCRKTRSNIPATSHPPAPPRLSPPSPPIRDKKAWLDAFEANHMWSIEELLPRRLKIRILLSFCVFFRPSFCNNLWSFSMRSTPVATSYHCPLLSGI